MNAAYMKSRQPRGGREDDGANRQMAGLINRYAVLYRKRVWSPIWEIISVTETLTQPTATHTAKTRAGRLLFISAPSIML
jgi:hypothetical protein